VLLVLEVGNTNTKVGVYDGDRLHVSWRLTTRREQTADEYGLFIEALLRSREVEPRQIEGVAISNVVPPIQQTLEWMAEKYFKVRPFCVEPYGPPLIVVDLGTTTRFDCVSAAGEFIGGAIAPGIAISTEALVARAARLFRVELVRPKEAIGRNTVTNIQSGVVYGYAGLVDGLVDRMKSEMAGKPKVVATGGNARLIAGVARSIDHVNEDLGLEGLRILWAQTAGR
jgi:type III pantothenate kinase